MANILAVSEPIRIEPIRPGIVVLAIASIWSQPPAAWTASSMTGMTTSKCERAATSGTTPLKVLWISICELTILLIIWRPSATTAAAVSSHELSTPNTFIGYILAQLLNGIMWLWNRLLVMCATLFWCHITGCRVFWRLITMTIQLAPWQLSAWQVLTARRQPVLWFTTL